MCRAISLLQETPMPYFARGLADVYKESTDEVTNVETVGDEVSQSMKLVDCEVNEAKSKLLV